MFQLADDAALFTGLTFSFEERSVQKCVALSPTPSEIIPHTAWQQLAENIAQERGLSHYQAETLSSRWEQGRAAIALNNCRIVAYISLIPIVTEGVWARLSHALGISRTELPVIEMYESATGWTHPAWRQQGKSLQLRRQLLARFSRPGRFFVSATIGLGASYVLPRLDWRLISWGALPFATSLMGLPTANLADRITVKARQPAQVKPYFGEHTTPRDNPGHPWADYCHFWLSNQPLAAELDQQISSVVSGDLAAWREIVATMVFPTPPEPTWKPFLFDERYG